jgi:hypothetical protein
VVDIHTFLNKVLMPSIQYSAYTGEVPLGGKVFLLFFIQGNF